MRLSDGEVLLKWVLNSVVITAGWTYNDGGSHRALDFRAPIGTPVYAAEKGTISMVHNWDGKYTKDDTNSYGNAIKIKHDNYKAKSLETLYAHLSKICVKLGDVVQEGQLIGYSGNTGNCAINADGTRQAHLHYEVRYNGTRVNPLYWHDNNFTCANDAVKAHLGIYQSVVAPKQEDKNYGLMIDVSYYQGNIVAYQWNEIKQKCSAVMLRFGYRGYTLGQINIDEKLKDYVSACIEYGIPFGVYMFTQAINEKEAIEEADAIAKYFKPSDLKLPVAIDTELANKGNGRADNLDKSTRTACIKAFCERLKQLGFKPMIYASTSWFANNLNDSELLEYDHWVADYRGYCGYNGKVAIWQTDSKNSIGISGYEKLDCNIIKKDYFSEVKTDSQKTIPETYNFEIKNITIGDVKKVENLMKELEIKDYNFSVNK